MQLPGNLTIGLVGRDERREGSGTGVGEKESNLSYRVISTAVIFIGSFGSCSNKGHRPHLSNPTNIFHPILLTEAQIFVQPKSYIVPIESVSSQSKVEEVLLKSDGDGGFAGGREAGEP